MPKSDRPLRAMLAVIAFILVIWALRASWMISMPLTFAVFLAIVLRPVQERMQAWGAPRWLGAIAATLLLVCGLAALGGAVWMAAAQVARRGPQLEEPLQQRIAALVEWGKSRGLPIGDQPLENVTWLWERSGDWLTSSLTAMWTTLGVISLIIILLVMLLFEAEQWRTKARRIFDNETAREVLRTTEIITKKLEQYLIMRIVISAISGALAGLWCLVLGVELAFVWALSSFALNFLPNIGSLISFIPPTLFAWIQYDWKWALVTFGAIAGTDMIMGNVVDPRMQGHSLRLSPFVVLFAVIFWGWVWGVGGALLAVPIMASAAIICLHVRGLEPIGRWLGEA
jgi:AI-2 transport protein TqsA